MKEMTYAECTAVVGAFATDYGVPHRPAPAPGGLTQDWGDVGFSTFNSTPSYSFDAFAGAYSYAGSISGGGGGG
uniref:hypothetical protein n=1 Tax=Noviherbaspirillum sp. TaxID=1926288 RepID=UPI002FE353BF